MKIKKVSKVQANESVVLIGKSIKDITFDDLTKEELKYIKEQHQNQDKTLITIHRLGKRIWVSLLEDKDDNNTMLEKYRNAGNSLLKHINPEKLSSINIVDQGDYSDEILAVAEGLVLGNYQFIKYKSDKKKVKNALNTIKILSSKVKSNDITKLENILDSVILCRDLVNEPVCNLDSVKLASTIKKVFKGTKAKVEVMNKAKIESLKMGGLLAVNKGSIDPPTFSIIEWKPTNAKNKKPLVIVGKGIVYDTGGLSLKPSNYMTTMKSDMSGAAATIGLLNAIVQNELPVHVIALVPATDNRPGGNAYVPDDIIKMYDGTSVEVKNTDAEGRMILADALAYAKKYKPELVIDMATLTGAAARAIGSVASVAMTKGASDSMETLKAAGYSVHERIAEFPFWDDYDEMIKSKVADINNTGGAEAGAITAGKFLAHFTDYPYIHIDIAGTAFLDKVDGYRPAGGTGVGIRLLYDFASKKYLNK